MSTELYNEKDERIFRINGFFDIDVANEKNRLVFIQGMKIKLDASLFQRDNTGTGESVFTQNGDVIGTFSFNTKNTVDLFDNSTPAVSQKTISFWWTEIAKFDPPILDFIQTMNAPNASGDEFARIKFKGRIMAPEVDMTVEDAVGSVDVTGEVTFFDSALRSSN